MAYVLMRAGFLCAVLALAACGKIVHVDDAAPPGDDAATIDASASDIDAAPDEIRGPPGQEITSGGARVTGGGYTVDVQLGHWFDQGPVTGGGQTTEGGAAIKP